MFHLSAYSSAVAGAVTNSAIAAVVDGYLTRTASNNYIYQRDMKLFAAAAFGDTVTNARINTPRYRGVSIPSIVPVWTLLTTAVLGKVCFYEAPWLTIPAIDEVSLEVTSSAAVTTNAHGFVWAGDGNTSVPQGDKYTLRATAAITAVANVWTAGTITFDQVLPAGTYSVIGMDAIGATLMACRLRFQAFEMLPGCPGRTGAGIVPDWRFRNGRLGEWGRFPNTAIPSIEVFCNAADTAQTVFLDVVKVG